MEQISVTVVNDCRFLLSPIDVIIGDESVHLKRKTSKRINLPAGEQNVVIRDFAISCKHVVNIDENTKKIYIVRQIPDLIYALSIGLLLILYTLFFTGVINNILPSAFTILVVLGMASELFFLESYFKVKLLK